jgi:hypothetical protein
VHESEGLLPAGKKAVDEVRTIHKSPNFRWLAAAAYAQKRTVVVCAWPAPTAISRYTRTVQRASSLIAQRRRVRALPASKRRRRCQLRKAAGRAYVERNLDRVIVLGPNERMVSEAKALRIESGAAVDGTGVASNVVAQRVVFTREIDGIPVVGAGSKARLPFLTTEPWNRFTMVGRVIGKRIACRRRRVPRRFCGEYRPWSGAHVNDGDSCHPDTPKCSSESGHRSRQ